MITKSIETCVNEHGNIMRPRYDKVHGNFKMTINLCIVLVRHDKTAVDMKLVALW
jgi:hypothetical protein